MIITNNKINFCGFDASNKYNDIQNAVNFDKEARKVIDKEIENATQFDLYLTEKHNTPVLQFKDKLNKNETALEYIVPKELLNPKDLKKFTAYLKAMFVNCIYKRTHQVKKLMEKS